MTPSEILHPIPLDRHSKSFSRAKGQFERRVSPDFVIPVNARNARASLRSNEKINGISINKKGISSISGHPQVFISIFVSNCLDGVLHLLSVSIIIFVGGMATTVYK